MNNSKSKNKNKLKSIALGLILKNCRKSFAHAFDENLSRSRQFLNWSWWTRESSGKVFIFNKWTETFLAFSITIIPLLVCVSALMVREKALAAARIEAKDLGRELSENESQKDEDERIIENERTTSNSEIESDQDDRSDENAAPLHLHSMRTPARLKGANNAIAPAQKKGNTGSLSRSSSRGSSRSRSSQGSQQLQIEIVTVPLDILTDRKGFEELEPHAPHGEGSSAIKLTAVNERLSEDTLEDVHAFNDLVSNRTSSLGRIARVSSRSLSPDNSVLETLDEEDSMSIIDDDTPVNSRQDGYTNNSKQISHEVLLDLLQAVSDASESGFRD